MGNRGRVRQGGTGTEKQAADAVSAAAQELPAPPPGCACQWPACGEADLDAYIQKLVDAAPPLTGEQRDTLALLLRHPPRRVG